MKQFQSQHYISDEGYLKKHFLYINEIGSYYEGILGFEIWCNKRNLPFNSTFSQYKALRASLIMNLDKNGFYNITEKIINTEGLGEVFVESIHVFDYYILEPFEKTKLGMLIYFGKFTQNVFLMRILLNEIKSKLSAFLEAHQIEAIGFIPPTIKRETQLMQYLQDGLEIDLPLIHIKKISGLIAVPQKSLQKIEERINNADLTFTIPDSIQYNKILLIDDAVGSGATINQIAKKIKNKNKAVSIIGLAIVGSFKGFDVITDV